MPGKFASASVVFLIDGYNILSAAVQSLRHKVGVVTEATHGLGDSWHKHTPVGMRFAELAQEGAFFDTSAGNIHEALGGGVASTPQSTMRVACVGYAGNTVAAPFTGFEGLVQGEYEALGNVGALQRANAAYTVSGKGEDGHILHALGAETADANTEASSVDNTSAAGGRTIPITSNSQAAASVVTTPVAHGLTTGDTVLIAGVSGSSPTINGERTVTVLTSTTFSVPVDTSAGTGGTGGTFTRGKTQNGGSGYLQVTAISLGGHTAAQVTVRHSADNATFADLVAFTARTAIGAERVTVTGTVNRYTAVALDFTGAGSGPSITYFAGFARG